MRRKCPHRVTRTSLLLRRIHVAANGARPGQWCCVLETRARFFLHRNRFWDTAEPVPGERFRGGRQACCVQGPCEAGTGSNGAESAVGSASETASARGAQGLLRWNRFRGEPVWVWFGSAQGLRGAGRDGRVVYAEAAPRGAGR